MCSNIKAVVAIVASLAVAPFVAVPASGQEPAAPTKVEMRLMQCVEAALRNNSELSIERMTNQQAAGELTRAWADFDPFVTADGMVNHSITPAGSTLLGADVTEQERVQLNVGVGARIRTGGVLKLDFNNERQESNSVFQDLNPQFTTSLVFSVTQPLLRNGWSNVNMYRVRVAKNNLAASKMNLESVVLDTVSRVEEAYWGLVLAMENLDVQRLSVQLADDVLEFTRAQVRTGILPEVASLQAEAGRASRIEGLIVAENAVEVAQRNLQTVLNVDRSGGPVEIVPVDRPADVQEVDNLDAAIDEAIANNFQIRQLEYQLENAGYSRRLARNQVLPRLDAFASLGLVGVSGDSGDPTTTPVYTGRVVPDPTLTSLGILETSTYTYPPNSFDGTYPDALNAMTSGDYYNWTLGLQFQYPIGNRAARADYERAMLEERKLAIRVENTKRLLETAIRNMASDFTTNAQRVRAAETAAELSRKNMEAERKKFQVGMSTNRDVLEAQERYAMALMARNRALMDYNRALGRLERARLGYLDAGASSFGALSVPTGGANMDLSTMGGASTMSLPSSLSGMGGMGGLGNLPAGFTLPF